MRLRQRCTEKIVAGCKFPFVAPLTFQLAEFYQSVVVLRVDFKDFPEFRFLVQST